MKKLVLSLVLVSLMIGYAHADMVLYLPFNEGSGTDVGDLSAYGNNGAIVDDVNTVWAAGMYGGGIEILAKTADPVVIPNSDSLMIEGAISMMAWIKPEAWSGEGHNQLLDKRCHNGGETNFCIGIDTGQGTMIAFLLGTGDGRATVSAEAALALSEWQHIAGTYDGSVAKFYLNGALVGEDPQEVAFQGTNDFEVRIGGARDRAHYGYVGSIDEFVIFDNAISEAEVNSIMNGDLGSAVSSAGKLATTWASIKE